MERKVCFLVDLFNNKIIIFLHECHLNRSVRKLNRRKLASAIAIQRVYRGALYRLKFGTAKDRLADLEKNEIVRLERLKYVIDKYIS